MSAVQEWYTTKGPFAGLLRLVVPVLGAYNNHPNGHSWSLRYNVERDGARSVKLPKGVEEDQEFFIQFMLRPHPSRGGRISWEVHDFDEESATELGPRLPKPAKRRRSSAGGASDSETSDAGGKATRRTAPWSAAELEVRLCGRLRRR